MSTGDLWQPNNHGVWKIAHRPVQGDVRSKIEARFLEAYRHIADTVLSMEQVAEAEVNSNNFRARVVKDGVERTVLVRRYPSHREERGIMAMHHNLRMLAGSGVRVPAVIAADDGRDVVPMEGGHMAVFEFDQSDHYRGTMEELEDAGRTIGKLDAALVRLEDELAGEFDFTPSAREARACSPEIWAQIGEAAEGRSDEFSKTLVAARAFIEKTLAAHVSPGDVPVGIHHFDLHPHNLLANGKKLVRILDFDSLKRVERMRALSFALHRLVRQHVIHTQPRDITAAAADAARIFLAQYQKAVPLTRAEIDAIPYFIRDESLARLASAMKLMYFKGDEAWKGDLSKQLMNIREAAYFDNLTETAPTSPRRTNRAPSTMRGARKAASTRRKPASRRARGR